MVKGKMDHTVEITGLAFGGKGVGRIGGKVVFVPYTAPGDMARVSITAEKKSFCEGELARLEVRSPLRVEPRCRHFGDCGGCALQHIEYSAQVEWKQRILVDTLKRIGGVVPQGFDAPAPSPLEYGYRTRASFHVDGRRWGFFETGSHRVVDIEECPVLDERIFPVFRRVKERLLGKADSLFAVDIACGAVAASGDADGAGAENSHAAAAFYVGGEENLDWKAALDGVEGLSGFEVWRTPSKRGKGRMAAAWGNTGVHYTAAGLGFDAGVSVFTQANLRLNPALIERAVEYAAPSGAQEAADLCCGAGNLTLPLARSFGSVTGVEENGVAVDFARKNAELNSVGNASFVRSGAVEWVRERIKNLESKGVDVVILDPPRGGDTEVAKALRALRPQRVVYVSCSPPTLARDISSLAACGYRVLRAGLFDMFPQTYHIESITGLELSKR